MHPQDDAPIPTTIEILDRKAALAQKSWEINAHLTPAQRIALIEHLRIMWHGEDALNARIPRVLELTQRKKR